LTLGQGKSNFFSNGNIDINVLDCNRPLHLTIPEFFVFSQFNLHNLKNLSSLTIECAEIGQASFMNCESLREVTFSNNTLSIGDSAFYGCNGLVNINISDSVKEISNRAFSYCTGLQSVKIGYGVTSIENQAFGNCGELTSLIILNSYPPKIEIDSFFGSTITDVFVPTKDAVIAFKNNPIWIKAFPENIIKIQSL